MSFVFVVHIVGAYAHPTYAWFLLTESPPSSSGFSPGDHEAGITVYFPRGTSVALPWGRTKPNHSYTYVPCTGKLALDGKGFSNRRYGKVGSMLLVSVSSSVFYHVRDLSFKSWGPFHFLYLEHSRCSCWIRGWRNQWVTEELSKVPGAFAIFRCPDDLCPQSWS